MYNSRVLKFAIAGAEAAGIMAAYLLKKRLRVHGKTAPACAATSSPYMIRKLCRKVVYDLVSRIQTGGLQIVGIDGDVMRYGESSHKKTARLVVNDNRFYPRVVFGGEVGFGEAYVDGYWDSPDLERLFRVLVENRKAIFEGNLAVSVLSRIRDHTMHLMQRNTVLGSKRNIERHYDLSNDFFAAFLDASMTYSCGLFLSDQDTLEDAQKNKLHSIITKAGIGKGDHVLEIGCGWGSFAMEAAQSTGCRVTGITLSHEQFDYARARVKEHGLSDRITILLQDYRDVQGRFDKIVSIEMLEAVGHEYLGTFFACCDGLLAPDGLVVLQVITIPDQRYAQHKRNSNWIQKHIFPGGNLPSLSALSNAMAAHSGFIIEDVENIGMHYVKTLQQWRSRFLDASGEISKLGFDRSTRRKWEYYFCVCEAQFAMRVLSDLQIVLTREGNKRLPGVIQA